MTVKQSPCQLIADFADSLDWPHMLPKRAWAAYKRFHDFECSNGAGFSASAVLQAAYYALRRRREAGQLDAWRGRTVADLLAASADEPLGFLPPVDTTNRALRAAGKSHRLDPSVFGDAR